MAFGAAVAGLGAGGGELGGEDGYDDDEGGEVREEEVEQERDVGECYFFG